MKRRFEVEPGPDGLVEVTHGLGTVNVSVQCQTAAGVAVGHMGAVSIDENRVEVATLPGSGVAAVVVEPAPHSSK